MSHRAIVIRWGLAGLAVATAAVAAQAQPTAPAATPVKLGIVSFLTGPAASPFGIPGRNGAEIVIEALNAGKAPAPFNTVGFAGSKVEAKYVDEAGSAANVVTEFRNLVQRDQVDAVIGYVSSGSCLAVTPVAEELKALTVFYDCGTPRIFEEKARNYLFRVSPHATMDSVGAARYLLAKKKNLTSFSGINQNYAWGHEGVGAQSGSRQGLVPETVLRRVWRRSLDPADLEIAGAAHQFLRWRPRRLHLPGTGARSRQAHDHHHDRRRSGDLASARQAAGRHYHRRPRRQRPARARHRDQQVVPEGLYRPLQRPADLYSLPDGAVAARPQARL